MGKYFSIEDFEKRLKEKSSEIINNLAWDAPNIIRSTLLDVSGNFSNLFNVHSYKLKPETYLPKLKELLDKYQLKPVNSFIDFEYVDPEERTICSDRLASIYVSEENSFVIDICFPGNSHVISGISTNNVYFISESSDIALKFCKDHAKIVKEIDNLERSDDKIMYSKILVSSRDGLKWINLAIPPKNEVNDISENYPKDFLEVVPEKMDKFLKEDSGGIIIFRGEPGTGKSTYCKHLIKKYQRDVDFLIVNQDLILSNPEAFRLFLIETISSMRELAPYDENYDDNPLYNSISNDEEINSNLRKIVIIIEDCEKLLIDRDSLTGNNTSLILSDILNYSDGIIGDLIQCKFIFTFNTHLSKIDKALLRKGRMKLNYEFQKLKGEDLKKLLKKLSKSISQEDIENGLTLAEIYNLDEEDYSNKERKIGF